MGLNPDNPPEDFRSVLASVDRQGRRKWQFTDIAMGPWRQRRISFGAASYGVLYGRAVLKRERPAFSSH